MFRFFVLNLLLVKMTTQLMVGEIEWRDGQNGVIWAHACDFPGNDLSSAQVAGEQCGDTCINTSECTHFAWTNYEGGTCWMKSGSVEKSNAIANDNFDMVCGIVPKKLKSKSKLVWSDEFNYNGLPDQSKWTVVNGGGGFGNHEAQFYTSNNLKVGGGFLTIQARKQRQGNEMYTSGKITSKVDFTYGIFEMRAKIPQGRGTWAAFWLLNPNNWPLNGEIDIMGKNFII
jgi:hypothetical protein